jgi:hypothetical protein
MYGTRVSVSHNTNAFVPSRRSMIRVLRRFKKVLDELGLQLLSGLILSVANKFADATPRC